MSRQRLIIATLTLALSCLSSQAQPGKPKGKPIKPDRDWVGIINDDKLAKAAPKPGIIINNKVFEKLWKAWRKDEAVPEIDFKQKVVVVTLSLGGPNRPSVSAFLDDEGNLRTTAISTLIGGPGFGYSIALFDRKGIKKINGTAIAKE